MQAVREHIKMNDLKVGDTLPGEGHFVDRLGVSRAVIREAFGGLAALRLIDVGNGRRARVGAIDGRLWRPRLITPSPPPRCRSAKYGSAPNLELRTAELAAINRTDAEAAEIMRHAKGIAEAGEDSELRTMHDLAFHASIARASHNNLFLQIVRAFAPMMEIAIPAAWHTRKAEIGRDHILQLHEALAEAIQNRDAEAARIAMDAHFDASIRDQLVAS